MLLIITSSDDLSIIDIENDLSLSSKIKVLHYDTFIVSCLKNIIISNKEDQITFEINNETYNLNNFDLVWYKQFSFDQIPNSKIILNDVFNDFYKNELKSLHYYFHHKIFTSSRTINSPFKGISNKLIQLDVFVKNGFKIPETKIITERFEIDLERNEYITKGISIPPQTKIDNKLHIGYTTLIGINEKDFFEQEKFFPTLIQEKINIKSELRVFYILGKIFAISIVVDRKNHIDYRSTNYSDEFKSFPVKLSSELEQQICTVMNELNLDSGSLDILINENDECIFLEVNKYGQFGMINETNSNYMLKKVISMILTKDLF